MLSQNVGHEWKNILFLLWNNQIDIWKVIKINRIAIIEELVACKHILNIQLSDFMLQIFKAIPFPLVKRHFFFFPFPIVFCHIFITSISRICSQKTDIFKKHFPNPEMSFNHFEILMIPPRSVHQPKTIIQLKTRELIFITPSSIPYIKGSSIN